MTSKPYQPTTVDASHYNGVHVAGSAHRSVIHAIDLTVHYAGTVEDGDVIAIRINGRVIKTIQAFQAERLGIVDHVNGNSG